MNPQVWGPHAWIFLHTITLAYPECPAEDDKDRIKTFFNNLQYVLPCSSCKDHFGINLKKYPLTDDVLSSKEKLVKWMIDIHNEVNKMNGNPAKTYTEVLVEYDKMYNGTMYCYSGTYIIIICTIILILICLLVIWYIYTKNKESSIFFN